MTVLKLQVSASPAHVHQGLVLVRVYAGPDDVSLSLCGVLAMTPTEAVHLAEVVSAGIEALTLTGCTMTKE